MPYLAHFGLKEHPFTLTPNIDFYYPTQETANIVASLDFALRRDSGIVKIVGEVGTGKTLLCRLLINKLVDSEKVAYINAPQADAQKIVRTVCEEFGIESSDQDGSPYSALNRFLVEAHSEGKLAVVVVDEAQHLGKEGLEAIRLISNLETERRKLLQIVLFGQTELDDLLTDPSLRQLNQRVVFSFNTKPLTMAEAKNYVRHRLRVSRREGVEYDIFSDTALAAIAERSAGIPRVINILADKSLLVAYSAGSPTVQPSHARDAIRDTPGLTTKEGTLPGWRSRAAAALLLLAASGGAFALLRGQHHPAPPSSAPPPGPGLAQAAAAPSDPPPAEPPLTATADTPAQDPAPPAAPASAPAPNPAPVLAPVPTPTPPPQNAQAESVKQKPRPHRAGLAKASVNGPVP